MWKVGLLSVIVDCVDGLSLSRYGFDLQVGWTVLCLVDHPFERGKCEKMSCCSQFIGCPRHPTTPPAFPACRLPDHHKLRRRAG